MYKFIIKRIIEIIPVMLGILVIVFVINHITPGDPVVGILGTNYTQEQYDNTKHELGLDQPVAMQFWNYLKGVVTKFDLGTSYTDRRAVNTKILERFPVTLLLGVLGLAITILLGLPLGILSATKQYSFIDYSSTILSLFFTAAPSFWLALMMILLFSLKLQWVPATGVSGWTSYILPSLAIGLCPVAAVTRMTRSSMLEVVRQDYIRTARAKGMKEGVVIRKHALRNALIPIITVVGVQLGMLFGGSAVVEVIFSIPGLGLLMLTAIQGRDYPTIQGCVLFTSLFICLCNLLVDIVYAFADPRIMSQYTAGSKKNKKKAMEAQNAVVEGGELNG